jgi:hypothetical protein
MNGFQTNLSKTNSTLSNESAINILNSKTTVLTPGSAVTKARVSSREFRYDQSGDIYYIMNTGLMTEQQSLRALYEVQNGLVGEAANNGLSANVSAAQAEMIRNSHKVTFNLKEVERETKSESFKYELDKSTGKVDKIPVPTGSTYKTLQIVADSIRQYKEPAASVVKMFTFELPVAVEAPIIKKKTNEEVILDFEAAK